MPEQKSSRDQNDLHPNLAKRWALAHAEFNEKHPDLPQVFLTQTYRTPEDQEKLYAQGRTEPGKVVTNARPGQSLHNYYPALAFDIAFKRGAELYWDISLFRAFAAIANSHELEWGGDWQGFKDNPHFQPPNYTWEMARQKLEPEFKGAPGAAPAIVTAALEKPGPYLRKGASGDEVVALQKKLKEQGFSPGKIDGIFGPATNAAVRAFQKSAKLLADGVAGPRTLKALEVKIKVEISAEVSILQIGSLGSEVVRLQKKIKKLGFDPGPLDGVFGLETEAAVIAFQEREGLLADGIAGPLTQRAMKLSGAAGPPPGAPAPAASGATPLVSVDLVSEMFPDAHLDNIKRYLPLVLMALMEAELADKEMILMALATIRAETAGFRPIDEGISKYNTSPGGHPFDLYDSREDLGNQGPPDGRLFKGRGFIQLTGRDNYQRYGEAIGLGDRLVGNPDLANDAEIAARLLARFLKDKERRIKEALLDGSLNTARRLVNGGRHGLAEFSAAFKIGERLWA